MASQTSLLLYLLLLKFLAIISFEAARAQENCIGLGSTLYPNAEPWSSPSQRFAFGFISQGKDTFRVGIYMLDSENTVVWIANRDKPAVSSSATIQFVRGNIVLQPQDLNIAAPSEAAFFACMLDTGNLVLSSRTGDRVWQSFDLPTDTLLGGQILKSRIQLVSSLSAKDHSSGRFRLIMQEDGNLVAYPMNTENPSDAYWASDTVDTPKDLTLDDKSGALVILQHSSSQIIRILSPGLLNSSQTDAFIYRATLDIDGNFRLYSHRFGALGSSRVVKQWEAVFDMCNVKGFCGYNSYCTRADGEPRCSCIPGFNFSDSNDKFAGGGGGGCERSFVGQRCVNGKADTKLQNMITADLRCQDHPYFVAHVADKADCLMSCSVDCDCDAAMLVGLTSCQKYKLPLKYITDRNASGARDGVLAVFLKLSDTLTGARNPETYKEKNPLVTILILSLSFITYSVIVLALLAVFVLKLRITKYRKQLLYQSGKTSLANAFTLQTCTYRDLKMATNGFKQELGKGSFGSVFKGTFDKGKSSVAVKKLEKVVEEGEREFRAEMRVIGRTRHKNLVRLIGYCIEGSRRLLVYEYMSNGSLADVLFRCKSHPIWQERVRLGQDVARGILYLHEECEAPIIHCDIKPQNILLDEFWTAKISDFGLAKLLMPDQTRTFTDARGTRGYMAPEWNKNIPITTKVDIYSFGIVLLEIICCRKQLDVNIGRPEETLLSYWAYRCFAAGELDKLVAGGEEVDMKSFERLVKVALWCIQDEPSYRFPMRDVVLMIEGIVEVPIPSRPTGNSSCQS